MKSGSWNKENYMQMLEKNEQKQNDEVIEYSNL